ncbi:MAG: hypothetical protein JXB15_09055 [Anaerolineales bacterium]|nr:hypothetical protein [Anaerolineales bacterium]
MTAALTHPQIYAYFRMALATGLLTPQEMIAWTDRELLKVDLPSEELMELSLSGHLPYSQIIKNLYHMQAWSDYGLPLALLFARARTLLTRYPERLSKWVQGLCLLNAEAYLPPDVKNTLSTLIALLEQFEQGFLSQAEVIAEMLDFLEMESDFLAQTDSEDLTALGIEIPPKGT